jgi:hypothetical protein
LNPSPHILQASLLPLEPFPQLFFFQVESHLFFFFALDHCLPISTLYSWDYRHRPPCPACFTNFLHLQGEGWLPSNCNPPLSVSCISEIKDMSLHQERSIIFVFHTLFQRIGCVHQYIRGYPVPRTASLQIISKPLVTADRGVLWLAFSL